MCSRMLEELRAGKIDCVIVKDLSRFGRNYVGVGEYLERVFPMLNVRFISVNDQVDSFENLTPDTVSGVRAQTEDGNTFARITFVRRYYAPDYAAQAGQQSQVHFSFRVHQSHLYTLSDDGSATYLFTPGWFDDLEVQSLTIRWKASDGMVADTETMEDGYYVWTFGPMDYGRRPPSGSRYPPRSPPCMTRPPRCCLPKAQTRISSSP